ncbi:hypothetical protein [Jeotgalibacillus proteolyticus]|uniref:Transcriptional regulator n=1 Tax=Jeotgalibacillus proteolyticus TaxID=2082395 RepID=A0A2S5GDT5_9BACL|nr:hypothetical protein [Jeotgalibacillus proteolyticus]PPA71053.1 hypothetical protein C4B60_09765 [Jeotgalibacillus proteolyticus]
MKIGVVGSRQFLEDIERLKGRYGKISFYPYLYESPVEAEELIRSAEDRMDVWLFSGVIPYFYALPEVKRQALLYTYAPFTEIMVTLSLFKLFYQEGILIKEVSLDLPDQQTVHHVMSQLGANDEVCHIKDYAWIYKGQPNRDELNLEEFVRYHKSLYESGETAMALTSIHAVYDRLVSLGVPAQYMIQAESATVEGIERAIQIGRIEQEKKSQVAVIKVEGSYRNDYNSFIRSLNGTVKQNKNNWNLYSTRGAVEDKLYALLQGRRDELPVVGIGFGKTVRRAELHAEDALQYAKKKHRETAVAYLLDDKDVLSEWKAERTLHLKVKTDSEKVMHIAEEIDLAAKAVHLFLSFITDGDSHAFTANDFAAYTEKSRRSAERVIKKFVEYDYIKNAGTERPYDQGRPRAVYSATDKLLNYVD